MLHSYFILFKLLQHLVFTIANPVPENLNKKYPFKTEIYHQLASSYYPIAVHFDVRISTNPERFRTSLYKLGTKKKRGQSLALLPTLLAMFRHPTRFVAR